MSEIIENLKHCWNQDDAYHHSLKEGVVSSKHTEQRYFYLTSQLIQSYYEVLKYEVGDGWKDVMHTCGYFWGQSLHERMVSDIKGMLDFDFDNLNISEYFEYINTFFKLNGVGSITFASEYADVGIIFATVKNSIVYSSLKNSESEDYLTSGLLEGLFEKISEQDIACVQLDKPNANSSELVYAITGKSRIEAMGEEIKATNNVAEAARMLLGH